MAKKINVVGYHLEIRSEGPPGINYSVGDQHKALIDIKNAIYRHVDNVSYCQIQPERVSVCEYCGRQWTEDDDEYNGGCCVRDQDDLDFKNEQKEAAELTAEQLDILIENNIRVDEVRQEISKRREEINRLEKDTAKWKKLKEMGLSE